MIANKKQCHRPTWLLSWVEEFGSPREMKFFAWDTPRVEKQHPLSLYSVAMKQKTRKVSKAGSPAF